MRARTGTDRRDGSSTARHRGLAGLRPILVTVLSWLALLLAWRVVTDVDRPSGLVKFDPAPARFVDVQGASSPLYLVGRDAADGLLFVGDSRTSAGISLRVLGRETGAKAGILWNGFAQYELLLRGVRQLRARRLVVCLTPTSVYVPPLKRMEALARRERAKSPMQRIDERLDDELDAWRGAWLRPVDVSRFRAWNEIDVLQPDRQVGMFATFLSADQDLRTERYAALRADLAALQADGYQIALLRLPVDPRMQVVEDARFDPARWRELGTGLGLPYLDVSGTGWRTSDGSHLVGTDAEGVTRVVAEWLCGLGWCTRAPR